MTKVLPLIVLLFALFASSYAQDAQRGNEIYYTSGFDGSTDQTATLYDPVALKYRFFNVSIAPIAIRKFDPAKLYRDHLAGFEGLAFRHEFQKFYLLDENGNHKSYLLAEDPLVTGALVKERIFFKLHDDLDMTLMPHYELFRSPERFHDPFQIN